MTDTKPSDLDTYKRVLGYLKGRRWLFAIAILGYVVAAYAEVVFAQSLGAIVDVFNPDAAGNTQIGASRSLPSIPLWATLQGWPLVYTFPILICVTALFRGLGSIVGEYLIGHVSLHLVHKVRYDLFSALLDLPSKYFDKNSVGSISNRLTDTVNKLRDTATEVLRILLQDGFKLIVLVVTLIDLSGKLTLIFAATFPIVGVIVQYASRRFRRISQNIQRTMGQVTQVGQEAVSAHKVVKSFGGQNQERLRFEQASDSNRQQNSKLIATKASSSQFIQFIVAVALGALMGVLFIPEVSASMTTGDLVTYIAVAGVLVQPVRRLSDLNARLQAGLAAASEIFEHMDQQSEADGQVKVDQVRGDIEFRSVSFRYAQADEDALTDFSFHVEPGKTLAIVGESGSGKSTLVELLMGFYQPTKGEILIDGVPTSDYDRSSLRKQVALVSQDIFLFSDTVRHNVAYGELSDVSEEQLQAVLDAAKVSDFIERMPEGLDTIVSNRGESLSGGQRQRIALARALLKGAGILVLDEATSALDPTSESTVLEALRDIAKGRTTIVVAHRLSTIQNADYILVVDQGRIVERGTYDELVKHQGYFSTMFNQAGEIDRSSRRSREHISHSDDVIAGDLETKLVSGWYRGASWLRALRPLSFMFKGLASARRRFQTQRVWQPSVPLIVVGNITVGGTGKTPLVIWLTNWFRARGLRVGVVSRGYGGSAAGAVEVTSESDPELVGDEAPMIAERTGSPIVVDVDRVSAVQRLIGGESLDVVISDDGLQHYRLGRSVEIVVLDGERGLGNRSQLPEGPLRESPSRLSEVDWVVSNGPNACNIGEVDDVMFVKANSFVNVYDQRELDIDGFLKTIGTDVVAYSAIGNPTRFVETLTQLGLILRHYQLPDHAKFNSSHIHHKRDEVVVVTEKDYRKVQSIDFKSNSVWYLKTDVEFESNVDQRLETLCRSKGIQFQT